jgi:transposase
MKIIPAATSRVDARGTAGSGGNGWFEKGRGPNARSCADCVAGERRHGVSRDRERSRMLAGDSLEMAGPLCQRQAGLSETGDRGNEPKYGPAHGQRILALLDNPPPAGYSNWTAPLLARELGDIHEQYIWRFLRPSAGLPSATPTEPFGQLRPEDRSVRPQILVPKHGPRFVPKAADIVGLYMAPPTNPVVLSVDEKPSIQALERAQGYLKLPNGRAMIGQSHDYKRHGTSTLFAALNVGTGQIIGKHYKRRRRIEFRDFMNRVVKQYESKEIHVILDNLSTHKPKRDLWLARHPNVHFHYTPTHTSWLNQIEIWFSILAGQSLKAPRSSAALNWWLTSKASSTATTRMLARLSGPKAPSTKNASSQVSRFSDSGY